MAHAKQPKCLFCGETFQADARNAKHQKYCSQPLCRKASKAASQRAWLAKPENQAYFRGPENVARVQSWRAAHPTYWRRKSVPKVKTPLALQDVCHAQPVELKSDSPTLAHPALQDALQDLLSAQPAALIGFIAQFTGSALQEDIARTSRRLVKLGQDILAGRVGGGDQTRDLARAGPSDSRAV